MISGYTNVKVAEEDLYLVYWQEIKIFEGGRILLTGTVYTNVHTHILAHEI